jgi:hypothetical protein
MLDKCVRYIETAVIKAGVADSAARVIRAVEDCSL